MWQGTDTLQPSNVVNILRRSLGILSIELLENTYMELTRICDTKPRLEGFISFNSTAPEMDPIDINKLKEITSLYQERERQYGIVKVSYFSPQLKLALLVLDNNGTWNYVKSFEVKKTDAESFKPDVIYQL